MDSEKQAIEQLLGRAGRKAKAGALDEAAHLVAQALEIDGDSLRALDLMGYIRFFQKQYGECEVYCHRALEVKPDHAYALSGLGMSLSHQGRLEEGLEMMTRAMAIQPDWPEPYWDMAVILLKNGDKERAVQILERGKRNAPKAESRFQGLLTKIGKSTEGR